MRTKGVTRREIEEGLATMGDYVKMEYLLSCLKRDIDFEARKFVLVKLSGLYESKSMLWDAGKMMRNAAEINTTFQNKINDFVKSAELFVRGGRYDEADISIKRAIAIADSKQKMKVKESEKEFYKMMARFYISNDKRKQAMEAYEKMLTLEMAGEERIEAQKNLLGLYERLGKIREYNSLRGVMSKV